MDTNDYNTGLGEFNVIIADIQKQLADFLSLLSTRKVPTETEVEVLDSNFEELRKKYDDIVALAKVQLHGEELPPDGSSIDEYVYAIENSKVRIIRQQVKKAGDVLVKFIKIRAKLNEYAMALKPYQDVAQELLNELSENNIEKITVAMEAPDVFLSAMNLENINSTEGFKLLKQISEHYPIQVQWGLVGHQYYIDECLSASDYMFEVKGNKQEVDLPNGEFNAIQIETKTEDDVLVAKVDTDESNEDIEEAGQGHASVRKTEITEENFSDTENINSNKPKDAELVYEMLKPVNKIKIGSPSASSFRKDIVKLGKLNHEIKAVLPLLTNFGVLTKEQAYLFGVCMDCFEETDKNKNAVELSIDMLVAKGFLAVYNYEDNGRQFTAYCLTAYCNSCIKKDSISSQMKGFWTLSFGKYHFVHDSEIEKQLLISSVSTNEALLQYVYSVKDFLSKEQFKSIVQSIRFENGHYQVAVVFHGDVNICHMVPYGQNIKFFEEKMVLMQLDNEYIPETINAGIQNLFVFRMGEIKRYIVKGGIAYLSVIDSTPEEGQPEAGKEIPMKENVTKNSSFESVIDEQVKEESFDKIIENSVIDLSDSFTETNIDFNDKRKVEEDPVLLVNGRFAPSDDVFCGMIRNLLKKVTSTKDQLTSVIVQAVLLANAAGLEKGRPKAERLSSQLKLATHLFTEDIKYSSEYMTTVFANPNNENQALMLSSYLFAMLTPSDAFDYGMKNQTEMFFSNYENYFSRFNVFKPLFNVLLTVQAASPTGFSTATIVLLGSDAESENFMKGLQKGARDFLTVQSPKTRMKALPLLYSKR